MDDSTKVHDHFQKVSGAFDSIYSGEQRSFIYRMVDILFRRRILEGRRNAILEFASPVKDKDILDIGCGPGRYVVMLAKDEPSSILGLDMSDSMIELAKRLAAERGITDICKFEKGGFLKKEFDKKFDIIIAAGVADYTSDPKVFLSKIKDILNERAIISFPVKWTIFTPIRMLWLFKRKCPNYYYSNSDIKRLVKECGLKIKSSKKIGSFLVPGNYIVVCEN
ncbi:MAG: methyltransferase domain-containing protein [Candidatus Omnitrophica bacterium]|nr:methyltransferase domain-containing protein [Candidatus Omnitrophota bacterium]